METSVSGWIPWKPKLQTNKKSGIKFTWYLNV